MAQVTGIKLEGVKEYTEILNGLPERVRDQVLRSFNRKAATQEVLKPLRAALPYSSQTKKEIKVAANRANKTAVVAGPTSSVYYVRFVEKGTKERKGPRGRIRARNRIEPFVDSRINNVISFTSREYGNEINKFLEKKIKRLK